MNEDIFDKLINRLQKEKEDAQAKESVAEYEKGDAIASSYYEGYGDALRDTIDKAYEIDDDDQERRGKNLRKVSNEVRD